MLELQLKLCINWENIRNRMFYLVFRDHIYAVKLCPLLCEWVSRRDFSGKNVIKIEVDSDSMLREEE